VPSAELPFSSMISDALPSPMSYTLYSLVATVAISELHRLGSCVRPACQLLLLISEPNYTSHWDAAMLSCAYARCAGEE
jgi:hypothetical protein